MANLTDGVTYEILKELARKVNPIYIAEGSRRFPQTNGIQDFSITTFSFEGERCDWADLVKLIITDDRLSGCKVQKMVAKKSHRSCIGDIGNITEGKTYHYETGISPVFGIETITYKDDCGKARIVIQIDTDNGMERTVRQRMSEYFYFVD